MGPTLFVNRMDAAERLIPLLREFINDHSIVLAIPRGAVPMGKRIAEALHVPFDILLVKKIGFPGNSELAIGSVSIDGRIIDPEFAIRRDFIEKETLRLQQELKVRQKQLRGDRPPLHLKGLNVLIIDDGMATGNSMLSAVAEVRRHAPEKIIVAVPVASTAAMQKLKNYVHELICLHAPTDFTAVAEFYHDFSEVSDTEVAQLMEAVHL